MKFTIDQGLFAEALSTVGRAVSKRTTLPILEGIHLEAKADEQTLRLAATDLEISIECSVEAKVDDGGSLVVPAGTLTDIVRKIPFGAIAISSSGHNQAIEINWQNSSYVIKGQDAEQFPALPQADLSQPSLQFEQDALQRLLNNTVFASAANDPRPVLTGVQLTFEDTKVYSIGTDGSRIAYQQEALLAPGVPAGEEFSVVVPGRAMKELSRILESGEEGRLFVVDNQMFFELSGIRFVSRLLEGEYPRVMNMLPSSYPTEVVMNRDEFQGACERTALMTDSKERSNAIKLFISEGQVVIESGDPELGNAHEELDAELNGDEVDVAFNARLLLDGLRYIETPNLRFEVSGGLGPTRIRPEDTNDYFYIAMPLRNV